jgi:cell division transport system permease protein
MSAKAASGPPLGLRSSYVSVVVSMALVLFLLGLLGALLIHSAAISRSVRERFSVHIHLAEDSDEADRSRLLKAIQLSDYALSAVYVSKDSAAKRLERELDEEFVQFLGFNPLQDAFELHLKADYAQPDRIEAIAEELRSFAGVQRVSYDKALLDLLHKNLQRLGGILLGASILMLFISVMLINSSIRLAIYSRRFLIRTMQLVGATKGFIQRPFIERGLLHGLLGAGLAIGLLIALAYGFRTALGLQNVLWSWKALLGLAAGIVATGLLISGGSTYFAVKRYLGLKTDRLYY